MSWNENKLNRLRDLFDAPNSHKVYDAHAKHISSMIFDAGGTRRTAPYAGTMTFLDAPTAACTDEGLRDLDVAIIGMPMDLAVTNRPGSRFGPGALRAIERIGPYNEGLKCAPVHEMKVADVGDVRARFKTAQDTRTYTAA